MVGRNQLLLSCMYSSCSTSVPTSDQESIRWSRRALAYIAIICVPTASLLGQRSARAQGFGDLMSRIFFSVAVMEVAGTTREKIVIFWLFTSLLGQMEANL